MTPLTQPQASKPKPGAVRELSGCCDTQLSLDEFEEIGIDLVCVGGGHTMREPGIRFERPVLHKLHRFRSAGLKRTDLIVLAMHHENRNGAALELLENAC